MLTKKQSAASLSATGLRFGVVAARYNAKLADALLANCLDTLAQAGAETQDIKAVRVPGSFEICAAAGRLAKSGQYDCIIALGVLLQGQTRHAEHIGSAVAHGLTQISVQTGIPTIFGVVTAHTEPQARVRCLGKTYNRGREAALTAIEMAQLCKNL
jgi:6,7-dimethyl-8-ribityllumazine synthase